MQLCSTLNILWHCLSLGLEWKLTFSSPVATAEFSKFADILSAALSLICSIQWCLAHSKGSRKVSCNSIYWPCFSPWPCFRMILKLLILADRKENVGLGTSLDMNSLFYPSLGSQESFYATYVDPFLRIHYLNTSSCGIRIQVSLQWLKLHFSRQPSY